MKVLQINTDGSRLMQDIGETVKDQNERIWNMLGGFFDIVRLGKDAVMLVDDEGFLKHLPLNPAAMMLSGYPMIAGTALIFGVQIPMTARSSRTARSGSSAWHKESA